MALTQISTDGVKNDAISAGKIPANAVGSSEIADDAVDQGAIADEAVDEARLQISNAGSNGQFLSKQSGNTGGLTWADGASEGTEVKSTGESGTTKFLRVDGDGTSSWQIPPDTVYTHPNHSGEVTSSADGAQTIASDVVDEDNLKISNAGTNGQYLQKQSGNTGGLTWATVSAAPEVEAVASGTLATDDAVFFNVSGTVSKVVLTSVSDSVGSSVDARGGVSNSVSQWEFDSCRISDTTFAICWEKDGIKVVVGTISGTSISFGTILNTGNGTDSGNDFPLIDYCAKSGCLALAYKNGSDLSMRAISVSGNSLTEGSQATRSLGGSNSFGTTFALACGNSRYGAAGPMTGGLVFGRKSTGDDTYLYDFSISGNTVTIGANRNELNKKNDISQVFRSTNIIYCPLRDAYVVAYVDETYSGSPYLWMDSYTRNASNAMPTFKDNGGPLAAASMSTTICSLAYDSEHQNIAVAFNDNNNHTKIRKINFQSNYDLSDYDPVQFESGGSAVINWLSLVYQRELGEFYCLANNTTDGRVDLFRIETNSNGTELSYPSDSSHRTNSIVSHNSDKITLAAVGNGTIVTTIPSSNAYQVNSTARQYAHTSKNVTPSVTNFLGFSAGNYTNGQTAKIKIVGNTTTQSSLSPMTTYYITDTGTVSSTEGNPSIKAGYAISSTKMIITPQYMY